MSVRLVPDVAVPMADGVALVGDLFLPGGGPAPCVVVRTPYGTPGLWPEALAFAEAGVAAFVQDVRGRHRSDGVFVAGADETTDGLATLDWIVTNPWSDGRVLLSGLAYESYTAWHASAHPSVIAVASRQPWPPDPHALDDALWWRTDMATGRTLRPGLHALLHSLTPLPAPRTAQLVGADVTEGEAEGERAAWAEQGRAVLAAVKAVRCPTLHVGSWYCGSAAASLRHARATGGTAVMGGWVSALTHRLQDECAIKLPDGPDPADLMADWLLAIAHAKPWSTETRCLFLGDGWRDGDPVPASHPTYRALETPGRTTLHHDPAHPVPALPHSADLGPPETRPDMLAFAHPGPLTWHGRATLTADVTPAHNAELVLTLSHARPDGVRTRLTDAVTPIPPNGGRITLRTAPTAVHLPPADTLHIELTLGRPPRHPTPTTPTTLRLTPGPLLLPEPKTPS
ncbi:CocE/NonD family hydrolase [Actinocorallia sp. A-T 12471]|uniref:CocE/NonD family hydrolase n=1 Tax=Actinocorallia sp. A-T 12471 TaxID=3089813 RepID=UPI0029CDDD50|nr:CocE/NonD family hydrolase [Actinocorallia sp. A-T 12471]MDX6742424.1 CocE/NonD family hydrolase [Actinocorallia sp. A-T 12471]